MVAQLLAIAVLLLTVVTFAGAHTAAQEQAQRPVPIDIGVVPTLVSADTNIRTPAGDSSGPAGVQAYVDALRRDYPGARFEVGESRIVGGLIIVDWQGTEDGYVVVSGRTLVTIADGVVSHVAFLNVADVSAPHDA